MFDVDEDDYFVENDKVDLTKTKKKEMSAQTRALLLKLGYSNRYHHLQKGIIDDHDDDYHDDNDHDDHDHNV